MIRLVQGFDIISNLPIDGRILLSQNEMKEIADYLLPDKYFAICRDDGKIYLYDKNNVVADDPTIGFGKFRRANDDPNEYTDQEIEIVDQKIDSNVQTLDTKINTEIADVKNIVMGSETDIPEEGVYPSLVNKINLEANTWAQNLLSEQSTREAKDAELNTKIDNYKVNKNLVDTSDLAAVLENYPTVDNTARYIKASIDNKYRLTLQLTDASGAIISTDNTIDLPLESMVMDVDYVEDELGKALIITLNDTEEGGEPKKLRVPLDAIISGLVSDTTFQAHVDDRDVHIQAGERAKWNNVADNAITPDELSTYIVSGVNTTVNKEGDNVKIDAVDSTYYAAGGIRIRPRKDSGGQDIPYQYDISTVAATPYWSEIQGTEAEGDGPRSNADLDRILSSIETDIGSNTTAIGNNATAISNLDATKQNKITDTDRLASDLINDTDNAHKFVTEAQIAAWNAKQNALDVQPVYTGIGSNTTVPKITTNNLGQVTGITEVAISHPTVGNGILTVQRNGADIGTFAANATTNSAINIEVPTNNNQIANGAGYQTASDVSALIGNHNTSTAAHQDIRNSVTTNANDIDAIEAKIPAEASVSNQLADKEFVNNSIATNTATFRGTYERVEDLPTKSVISDLKNNDYAFVITEQSGNPEYNRYKYNAGNSSWVFEYVLNNSSFTSAQWAAIQSGITNGLVAQITTNKDNITAANAAIATKQNILVGSGTGQNIKTVNNMNLVGSGNVAVGTVTQVNLSTGTDGMIIPEGTSQITGSGTIKLQHKTSDASGSYGPSGNATPAPGSTFSVPSVTVDATGHISSAASRNITMPAPAAGYGLSYGEDLKAGVTGFGIKTSTATIPSSAWSATTTSSGASCYGNTVNVSYITEDSSPVIDVLMESVTSSSAMDNLNEAWSKVFFAKTSAGKITFYAFEAPTINIPIVIKG